MIIDPRHFTVDEWIAAISLPLSRLMPVPIYAGDWRQWAYTVLQEPIMQKYKIPTPEHSPDWQDWAQRLTEVLPI